MTPRIVTPEILDGLPNSHPAAIRSRRDLRRVHRAMGTRRTIVRTLRAATISGRDSQNLRILEIGAGDGQLMLTVAGSLRELWPKVELTLLDRLDLIEYSTLAEYATLGWTANVWVIDVLDWVTENQDSPKQRNAVKRWDLIIANLFLHHFEGAQLAALLSALATRTNCFLACEPRRSWLAKMGSHLIGAIGANSVTRTDAVLSVRAGFRDSELSTLWPGTSAGWALQEDAAGLFGHRFLAERISPPPSSAFHAPSL